MFLLTGTPQQNAACIGSCMSLCTCPCWTYFKVKAGCWVDVQQYRLILSTLQPGLWGGSTPWAFSGFQISVTDYPAISSLCLFDFLYRLTPIPNQTSFIDETTQPPSPWINTTWLLVYASLGATTSICSRKVHISSQRHERAVVDCP